MMVHLKNKKAIAFDLYNTLVYIYKPKRVYAQFLRTLGLDAEKLIAARNAVLTQHIPSLEQFQTQFAPEADIPLTDFDALLNDELGRVELFPETKQILQSLSEQYDLYLISNLASPYMLPFYNLGLDEFFTKTFFSCEVGMTKPDPAIFSLFANQSGFNKSELLFVGDSLNADYHGAMKSGISAVLVNRNGKHDFGIKDLTELQ